MSITAMQVESTPPPTPIDPKDELALTRFSAGEITCRRDRFEPICGSLKLHERNGQVCVRHTNGGGLVALTAHVQPSVFVGENAAVLGRAIVRGKVRIEGQAIIEDKAKVSGNVRLREEARVSGNAVLEGQVTMRRHSRVGGNAHLKGIIFLDYYAFVGDESRLFGNMRLE